MNDTVLNFKEIKDIFSYIFLNCNENYRKQVQLAFELEAVKSNAKWFKQILRVLNSLQYEDIQEFEINFKDSVLTTFKNIIESCDQRTRIAIYKTLTSLESKYTDAWFKELQALAYSRT